MRNLTLCLILPILALCQFGMAQTAYVVNFSNTEGAVSVVDVAGGTVRDVIQLPAGTPVGVAVSPDNNQLIVSCIDSVLAINPKTKQITALLSNYGLRDVRSVVYSRDGSHFYTIDAQNSVITPFNSQTLEVAGEIGYLPSGISPVGGMLMPDSDDLLTVANGSNNVIRMTAEPLKQWEESQKGGVIPVGSGPFDLAVVPGKQTAYVPNVLSNNVSVINLVDGSTIATIDGFFAPSSAAVSPDGAMVYVTNFEHNTVTVIDSKSNTIKTTIEVGESPIDVAFSRDGTLAMVCNSGSGTISIIDMARNEVTQTIRGLVGPPQCVIIVD